MAFDVAKFANEISLPDDIKTSLLGLFEKDPSVVTKLESVFTREVDSRLSPLQTALDAKQRDLDAQFETLASIRGRDSDDFDKLQKQVEKTVAERAVLETRLRKVAAENGIDPEPLLKDITTEAARVETKVESTFDRDKLFAEVDKRANVMGLSAFENAALMEDLATEHQTLFGKPMSRVELIATLKETVKRTGNTNLGLRDVFEQKYNVAARREEIREADVQKRIDAAVAAAKTAQADELALRSQSTAPTQFHQESPIFAAVLKDEKGNPAPVRVGNEVPEAVRAAMADFAKRRAARNAA